MNDEALNDELDLGVETTPAPWKKILLIVSGIVLLLAIGGGGAYFMFAPGTEQTDDEGETTEEQTAAEEAVERGPAFYHDLKPVFVVNLTPGGHEKMLQVGVQVLTRSETLVEFLDRNDPMIRHNLLKLFSTRQSSELADRAGKEELQAGLQVELQRIIDEQGGEGTVEAVFFTSFVMQ
ncbi:hypothetical protein MNBD_GAMMA26-784 [hydrothermal vent metagenome]|uniref:Flagellar protein FliL n=1 Tax=hydrothermal vent metagenome TaxID=652676 RepID=A0A3B1BWT5_9ZZZZ